jgi:ERCC4-type nuclease
LPYRFVGLRANADQDYATIVVPTRRISLKTGDYSIDGLPGVVVERKSKSDLFGSVARRDNFESRLGRMNALEFSAVVVEAEWREILTDPPPHSKLNPKALFRTILSWQQRFPGVHWLAMPGRAAAEAATFRILETFWRHAQRKAT